MKSVTKKKSTAKHRKSSGNVANLKKWPKGVSGNPAGRAPAGWSWAELIRSYGEKECPPGYAKELDLNEKPKWKEVVVAMAYRHAAEGNAPILKTLVEYIDGRSPLVAITNNENHQSIIILPALEDEEEYDPVAALKEMPQLLAPPPTNGNGNGNGYHS